MGSTVVVGDTEVARMGLGTNRLTNTPANAAFLCGALAAGIEHVDTAHSYTGGQSEKTIGEALSGLPDGRIVATKGGYGLGEGRPQIIRMQIEESLRRLGTESIGLYYLHRVHPDTPIEETLGAVAEYVGRGQIRHVGLSQVGIDLIERARRVLPIAAVQNQYNLSERASDEVVDYCAAQGIAFVPFFPLKGERRPALIEVAERHDATEAQIVLAWLLRRSPVMLPIPGTLSLEHVRENLAALEIELGDAEFDALS